MISLGSGEQREWSPCKWVLTHATRYSDLEGEQCLEFWNEISHADKRKPEIQLPTGDKGRRIGWSPHPCGFVVLISVCYCTVCFVNLWGMFSVRKLPWAAWQLHNSPGACRNLYKAFTTSCWNTLYLRIFTAFTVNEQRFASLNSRDWSLKFFSLVFQSGPVRSHFRATVPFVHRYVEKLTCWPTENC